MRDSPARIVLWPITFGREWARRFFAIGGVDRGTALGALTFTALFPLLIVYRTLVSGGQSSSFADRLIDRLDLHGSTAASVHEAFGASSASSVGVLGVVLVVVSALSFTRTMQRVYETAFGLAALSFRSTGWGLVWLALLVAYVTVRPVVLGAVGGVVELAASLALGAMLWLATPYFMLARRLHWRRLAPCGIVTATAMTALGVAGAIWLPRSVTASADQYGVIGVAFALLSWFVVAGIAITVAATGAR